MKSSPEQHMIMSEYKGLVFDIKRFAVHDGAGIRTTVFLKGCPLRCKWCQNPEGLDYKQQILYLENKCIKCKTCEHIAENDAIKFVDDKMNINRQQDSNWLQVVEECPTRALQFDSKYYNLPEIMQEITKDEAFFKYGGGVTLSGGEPLFQHEFALAILKACKQKNLHTAIETSLFVKREVLAKILPYVDEFYTDLKIFNNDWHKKCTNVDNQVIKNNLKFLLQTDKKDCVIVRTPLIPTLTATKENIEQISRFISSCYDKVKYELLNYNPLAKAKYSYLDKKYYFTENPKLYSNAQLQFFYDIAKQNGIKNLIIE